MNFIFQLEAISQAGSRFSYIVGALGLALILIACLVLNVQVDTAAKGAATSIMAGGLILALGGTLSGYNTSKELDRNTATYFQHRAGFLITEKAKVKRVHTNWFVYRILWILIAIGGCALLFTMDSEFWLGLATGAIFIGVSGVIIEAWSYRINERYKNLILKEAEIYVSNMSIRSIIYRVQKQSLQTEHKLNHSIVLTRLGNETGLRPCSMLYFSNYPK